MIKNWYRGLHCGSIYGNVLKCSSAKKWPDEVRHSVSESYFWFQRYNEYNHYNHEKHYNHYNHYRCLVQKESICRDFMLLLNPDSKTSIKSYFFGFLESPSPYPDHWIICSLFTLLLNDSWFLILEVSAPTHLPVYFPIFLVILPLVRAVEYIRKYFIFHFLCLLVLILK